MKLAILGTGMIVKEVLPVLKEISSIQLSAILSTPRSIETAKELAATYQICQATSDYQTILDNVEVDTVYIGTPNHTHYQYAREALLTGKNVICEKPFTLRLAEFEELRAIAKEKNLILLEAITNQYLENFQFLKEQVVNIGEIKIVECNYSQYSSRYDAFKSGEIAPAFNPEMGGGALRDLNIYNIHLVVGLFGSPKSVQYLPNMERNVDTSGILVMDYGQFKAVCIGAKDCSAEIKSNIQGNKGSLSVHGPTNSIPKVSVTLNGQETNLVNNNSQHHRMYAEFVTFEKIISKKDIQATKIALDHSQAVMEVLEAAIKSM